jgi:MoaA/NifB/PqqE/SkfB family radical SAM enzyme
LTILQSLDLPRKVYVEPTNACNLACETCMRHVWDEREGFMDWQTFSDLLHGFARLADRSQGQPTVAFMGLGEPLLHPRFADMVRACKERGFRVEVTTNALLLDEHLAAELLAAKLDQLVVSIDGTSAETFARIRSGADLAQVLTNVRRLCNCRQAYYSSPVRIGIEFVAMRSNVHELAGLNRLAVQIGASFIIVSNVLPYTEEMLAETLYDECLSATNSPESPLAPRWQLPRLDLDADVGQALGTALTRALHVSVQDADLDHASNRCPFIDRQAFAVSWDGAVSPCPPLQHSYRFYLRGREKFMREWPVGHLADETLESIWYRRRYAAFRQRVRDFDFPPCVDCACVLAEDNAEDCFGNTHPVCGDCLWARGVVQCP